MGGIDTVLTIPAQVNAIDEILKVCLHHWPDGVFEDDRDGSAYPLAEAASRLPSRPEQEFFVYRDSDASKDWESGGATSANANTMLHFIVGGPEDKRTVREVTVVCDQMDEAMQQLISELATQLRSLPEEMSK
jgi:hypothetical protein